MSGHVRQASTVPLQVREATVGEVRSGRRLVVVPRAVNGPHYWSLSWAALVAAAEAGIDGLSVRDQEPKPWLGRASDGSPKEPDLAFYREGRGSAAGRPMLLLQTW